MSSIKETEEKSKILLKNKSKIKIPKKSIKARFADRVKNILRPRHALPNFNEMVSITSMLNPHCQPIGIKHRKTRKQFKRRRVLKTNQNSISNSITLCIDK
jgi:hypothetical protein